MKQNEEIEMKIWEVVFDYKGEKEVHNFWETANSDLQKFIDNMTKKGDLTFISKRVIKEI